MGRIIGRMDLYRFFVPDLRRQLPQEGQAGGDRTRVPLPDDQGHHARSVLRLAGGEEVVLFDGAGAWAGGTVVAGGPKARETLVEVTRAVTVDPPPAIRLTLATAVPKGERAEWLVEQASQLNAWRVQWLACDRGVVKPREGGQKLEKWRRLAVESAKQCGRTHVMGVDEPRDLADVVGAAGAAGARLLWLDPRGKRAAAEAVREMAAGEVVALIGPEGGWSERETRLLAAAGTGGAGEPVRLTTTVLRIETACAAVAAVVMAGGRGWQGNEVERD
jgi:16S rRNA (uracil1498-N3)-methyltransferase